MSCGGVRRLLSAYADEQTNERERLAIGLHLSRCHECRQRYEDARRLRLALLSTPRLPVPPRFGIGWRARVREQGLVRPRPRQPWLIGVVAGVPAVACLILLATGLAFFSSFGPRTPETGKAETRKSIPAQPFVAPAAPSAPRPETMERSAPEPAHTGQSATASGPAGGASGSALRGGTRPGTESPVEAPGIGATSGEGTTRSTGPGTLRAPVSTPPADGRPIPPDASWRVWLTAIGPRPADLKRALVATGLLPGAGDPASLDVPLLLRDGLSFSAAQQLAQQIEESGAHVLVELAPVERP